MLDLLAIPFAVAAFITIVHLLGRGQKHLPRRLTTPPRTQLSRKWARAMFHMGYISIEELCHIYATTPPDSEDEVTTVNLQDRK